MYKPHAVSPGVIALGTNLNLKNKQKICPMPEKMPEKMFQKMSEEMHENMSEKMPEKMFEEMIKVV